MQEKIGLKEKNKLIKSRWIFVYKKGSSFAVFNSKELDVFFVDKDVVDLIEYLKKPHKIKEVFLFLKNKNKKIIEKLLDLGIITYFKTCELKDLKKEVIIEEKKRKELIGKESRLNSLRIVLTERCNMNCDYCFVRKRKTKKDDDICLSTIKKAIDLMVSMNSEKYIEVQFFGGEPLLKWDLIIDTVSYVDQVIKKGTINNVFYGITTNGTLITKEKAMFLKEHNFLVSVSLDGWKELHNSNRHYFKEKNSYDDVIKGLKILKKYNNEIGILVTPDKENIDKLSEACDYIINVLGYKFIAINTPQPINGNWNIDGVVFSQQIKKCIEIAKKRGAIINSFGTRVFYSLDNKKKLTFSCSKFNDNFAATLTTKGKISPCIVSWSDDKYLTSLDNFSHKGVFSDWKLKSPYYFKECLSCPAMNVCGGPCPLEVYEFEKLSKEIDHERCRFFNDFLEWAIFFEK